MSYKADVDIAVPVSEPVVDALSPIEKEILFEVRGIDRVNKVRAINVCTDTVQTKDLNKMRSSVDLNGPEGTIGVLSSGREDGLINPILAQDINNSIRGKGISVTIVIII